MTDIEIDLIIANARIKSLETENKALKNAISSMQVHTDSSDCRKRYTIGELKIKYFSFGWCDAMPFNEFLTRCEMNGVVIDEEGRK